MKIEKALRRDKKISKRRYGIKIDTGNISLSEEEKKKKDDFIRERREQAEAVAELTFTLYDIRNDDE